MCERCRLIKAENTPEEIAAKAKMAIYMAELSMRQVVNHLNEFIEYGKVADNADMLDIISGLMLKDSSEARLKLIADLHLTVEKQTKNPA